MVPRDVVWLGARLAGLLLVGLTVPDVTSMVVDVLMSPVVQPDLTLSDVLTEWPEPLATWLAFATGSYLIFGKADTLQRWIARENVRG